MKKANNNLAIRLIGVSKKYFIHHEKPTLAERIIKNRDEEFWALKKINLSINKGQRIGIIGSNGSGKTTLLKIISGITEPSNGKVQTEGKIVSLIDLDAGFHPELTGDENIRLNGLLLGMSKREIEEKRSNIVAFADIGNFISAPFYTYSEGMKLRLGFAVAIHTDPDIVLLDENIAVGDKYFSQKSHNKIKDLLKSGKTILIVSHWLEFLKENCDKVIWMEKGRVKRSGGMKLLEQYAKYKPQGNKNG